MAVKTLMDENFSSFPLGPFPYDQNHSAMGEYHFFPEKGYKGMWFDPIANWDYTGPSWLVTDPALDGRHVMEQQRFLPPAPKKAVPCLRAGETDWKDYTVACRMRPMIDTDIAGILFRYQTSMMHYGFFLRAGRAEIHRVNKLGRTILASVPLAWDPDDWQTLSVTCRGNRFICSVGGKQVLDVTDGMWKSGCVALSASVPAQYASVVVTMGQDALAELEEERKRHEEVVARKASELPKAVLWKKFDLIPFGAGRQIRFGHLTGTKELFFVMCQHQRRIYKDRYPFISCLTAVSFDSGRILWQIGEPRDGDDTLLLTSDLPFQVYDIDGDGRDEVICVYDFRLRILDGQTGREKKSIPTPLNDQAPETVTSLEFGRYASKRLNVDAVRIVNVSGKKRPSDILIKDRYSRLWVYDCDLELLWKFSKYNTGHFPYSYDFDGDGKDEIFSCYNMIDHDGTCLWSLPISTDHTDEIIVGHFDPDNPEVQIAIVSGWEGFMILDLHGHILKRDVNGHGQRISAGNYLPERKGVEIATTTYWGNNGIVYMHDCKGNEIWHREMLCNGNLIAPVDWDGSGRDLLLMNADPVKGGLIDGEGDTLVRLPDDGHPTLCSEIFDVTGDSRPEILCWDNRSLWVYTQDEPRKQNAKGVYDPETYPPYNCSNYRGEFSFPRWRTEGK